MVHITSKKSKRYHLAKMLIFSGFFNLFQMFISGGHFHVILF